jgi:hypothetical protein
MKYTITPLFTSGSKIRPDHNVFNTATSALAYGNSASGDELWIAPADGTEVKQGDQWLNIGVNKWVAVIHKGVPLCKLTENETTPPPPTEEDEIVSAIVRFKSGETKELIK